MSVFNWNNEKNEWLKTKRGICFEQIVILLERMEVFDIIEHPNQDDYFGQKIIIIKINDNAYLVPYVEDGKEIFLKTIIPSRKATNKYIRGRK